jgi:hypothetical protein
MKQISLFLCLSLILCIPSPAQSGRSITVRAGEDIAKAYSPSGFYRFPQFSRAIFYSKEGAGYEGLLFNYNLLADQLQFINKSGDTLQVVNPTVFDSIQIDKSIFYYDHGYLEKVAGTQNLRLVRRTAIKLKPEAVGAYGSSGATAAINQITEYTVGANLYSLVLNQDIVIRVDVDWYWMNQNGTLTRATKNNFLSLLDPSKQESVRTFLKQNKISFAKEDDLVKLTKLAGM